MCELLMDKRIFICYNVIETDIRRAVNICWEVIVMKKRILSLVLSFSMMMLLPVSDTKAVRQLNVVTTFGISETTIYGVPTAFTTRFSLMTDRVCEAYQNNFSINLNFTKPTTNYVIRSVADACRYDAGKPYDSICQHISQNYYCSNNGPYHCNNCAVIKDDVFSSANQSQFTLQMHITATKLCHQFSDTHGEVNGMHYSSGFALVRDTDYLREDYASNLEITNYAKTVAHEIGHEFGAIDHYSSVDDGNPYCIWGYYKGTKNVADNLLICSACRVKILQNSNEYFS